MIQNTTAPSARPAAKITTEELATQFRNVPQSIRAALCRNGHFCGLKPVKLPNGKLLWDAVAAERVLNGEVSA
jgi:hypothetical protein